MLSIILYIILAVVFTLLLYLTFKVYTSNTRHIPEPAGAWPLIGHSLSFLTSTDHLSLYKKFSEEFKESGVCRIRNVAIDLELIMISKPEWARYILSRSSEFPRDTFLTLFFPTLGEGILVSNGDKHHFQKRILAKAFSARHVRKFLPAFDKHVKVLVELWKAKTRNNAEGENIEVRSYTNNLSFDIISDVAFGYQADSQINEETRFIKSFRETVEVLVNFKKRIIRNFVSFFLSYLPFDFSSLLEYEAEKILDMLLQARKQKIINNEMTEFEKIDLLSIMVESVDEATGKSFSDKLIKDNCFTFLFAGFETVSTAIPILLYHFTQYPQMQERIRQEIETAFNELNVDDELTSEILDRLPYMEAFIRESLRFFPTIATNGRVTKNDCRFGKYVIPKGSKLFVLSDDTNKDPTQFDRPNEFIPERYMEGSSIKAGSTLSFGYGPYNCIGKHFAILEIKVTAIRLLQQFRFTIDEENNKFSITPMLAVKLDPPLKIRVQRLATKEDKFTYL